RIWTHPPPKHRGVVPRPEVRQPNLDILLLPRKPIVLPKPAPTRRTIVALGSAIRKVGRFLDKLPGRLVDHRRRRTQVVLDLEQYMRLTVRDRRRVLLVFDSREALSVGQ